MAALTWVNNNDDNDEEMISKRMRRSGELVMAAVCDDEYELKIEILRGGLEVCEFIIFSFLNTHKKVNKTNENMKILVTHRCL